MHKLQYDGQISVRSQPSRVVGSPVMTPSPPSTDPERIVRAYIDKFVTKNDAGLHAQLSAPMLQQSLSALQSAVMIDSICKHPSTASTTSSAHLSIAHTCRMPTESPSITLLTQSLLPAWLSGTSAALLHHLPTAATLLPAAVVLRVPVP